MQIFIHPTRSRRERALLAREAEHPWQLPGTQGHPGASTHPLPFCPPLLTAPTNGKNTLAMHLRAGDPAAHRLWQPSSSGYLFKPRKSSSTGSLAALGGSGDAGARGSLPSSLQNSASPGLRNGKATTCTFDKTTNRGGRWQILAATSLPPVRCSARLSSGP